MCKKLIYLYSFVLVLSLASSTSADLVARWTFDEGSGDTAFDSSGNNYHAILVNNPEWVPGKIGAGALNLDAGGYGGIQGLFYQGSGFPEVSVCAWIRTSSASGQFIASFDRNEYWRLAIGSTNAAVSAGQVGWHLQTDAGVIDYGSGRRVDDGQWHHVGGVYDNGTVTIYIDGEPEPSTTQGTTWGRGNLRYGYIGKNSEATAENQAGPGGNPVDGDLDDLRIYDHALTQAEVIQVMKGVPPGAASDPKPADEATDVPREVVLSWTPGEFAPPTNGHKLFLSENFSDVNDGIGGIAQDASSYARPQRLDLGTTYYWRVDEVNGPPDFTVYEGKVWSFTTELLAYPIEDVTATASSSNQADTGPENTINGFGLDANDLHSKEPTDMWLSSTEPLGAWIEFQFDKVYKLHEMWVWNSNQMIEPALGFGLKDVSIEYSTNGTDYATLGTTHEFARAPGMPDYAHNTTVDTGGVAAKYVRLTASNNWGGVLPQFGLSEVRFFYIPALAREPSPDSGATDVNLDVTLGFRGGREAATHNVYLSTDEQAVIDGTADVTTVTEASYGPLSLDLAQTYYWRVDEVNEAETPATWQGTVWNFTTHEFLVVDDFESYNDLDPTDPNSNRIFLTWLDGYGIATNGSLIGYESPPFAEQNTVHSGKQSMPFFYSNTGGAAYSEAERTFAVGQDWTTGGAKTLSLWFSGDPNNAAEQMYVKVNGSKIVYDGDAGDIAKVRWKQWNIDLASSGAGLQSITKLAIGVDGNGASGTLFFDDIRLYPYERQLITPVEPNAAGLVAHYEFEGTTSDSAGANHGTPSGGPTYALGKIGQAISLDGVDDYVVVGSVGISGNAPRTIAGWVKALSTDIPNWTNIFGFTSLVSGDNLSFDMNRRNYSAYCIHVYGWERDIMDVDLDWHHLAATYDGTTVKWYGDGRFVNSEDRVLNTEDNVQMGKREHNDNYFPGLLDDVRIFNRVLSQAEVAGLAGITEPFDKPF